MHKLSALRVRALRALGCTAALAAAQCNREAPPHLPPSVAPDPLTQRADAAPAAAAVPTPPSALDVVAVDAVDNLLAILSRDASLTLPPDASAAQRAAFERRMLWLERQANGWTERSDLGEDLYRVVVHPPERHGGNDLAGVLSGIGGTHSCPSGQFCARTPRPRAGSSGSAAAPYAACAESMQGRTGGGLGGAGERVAGSFDAETTRAERGQYAPQACCYRWTQGCGGGRLLRDDEGPCVAPAATRDDWLAASAQGEAQGLPPSTSAVVRDHWLREAAAEHASIASFAQATLTLLGLGAPAVLLEATQRAALDEVEHARLAYGLASRFSGCAVGPGALAARSPGARSLADFARAQLRDACANEGLAVALLEASLEHSLDPAVRAVLERTLEDERRHLDLAFATLGWALREEPGAALRRALREELEALLGESAAALGAPLSCATHEAEALRWYGVPTELSVRATREAVLREVLVPALAWALDEERAPPHSVV